MTSSTRNPRCRAQGGAANCTDPNCPERKAFLADFSTVPQKQTTTSFSRSETLEEWSARQLDKAYGDDPVAARGAEKQLRLYQQNASQKAFRSEIYETLAEETGITNTELNALKKTFTNWELNSNRGYPVPNPQLEYSSKEQRGIQYKVEADMISGSVTFTAKNLTGQPLPPSTQRLVVQVSQQLEESAQQWRDERKYINTADLRELYAD